MINEEGGMGEEDIFIVEPVYYQETIQPREKVK